MLFLDAMEEFLYDCECRHLTKGTIRNYRAALSFLNSYLEAKGKSTVEDVTAKDIRDFMREKQSAGCKPAYINDLLKAYKVLFSYLEEEGYISTNVTNKVKNVHQPKTVIETFSEEEIKALLEFYKGNDFLSMRNKTMIALLFDTGMRCNEMILMNQEDVAEKYIILTYMFDGSLMKSYLELFNLEYSFYRIENNSILEGKYDDSPFRTQVKALINVYEGKLNNVGEDENALSSNWFRSTSQKNKDNKNILRKNIYNYLRHKADSKVAEAMWTTFLGTNGRNKDKLQPRDYKTNTFVSCNARATNKFSNKMNLVYAVNVYINPYVSRYLQTNQVDIDGDKYALAQMLQWIWRSRIRNGYDINIYIPSSRMRRLLIQWMGN